MSSRGAKGVLHRLRKEGELLRITLGAAQMVIESSPCDSDATKEHAQAWEYYRAMYQNLKELYR